MHGSTRFSGITFILAVLVASVADRARAEDKSPVPADRVTFHVFLLMGQSNMSGFAKLEIGDEKPVAGVLKLPTVPGKDKAIAWVPAAHPLHNRLPSDQFGLGLPFAIEYQKQHPGVTVGLVPVAWGGMPIGKLNKGTPVYSDALKKAAFAEKNGVLKGVLWHQGESDTVDAKLAKEYADTLDTLVSDLRRDLKSPDLPFVAGNLAEFYGTGPDHKAPDRVARINQVRASLRALPKRVHHTAFVETNDLKSPDGHNVHFDRDSYIELGKRYAAAMDDLLRQAEKKK